MFDDFMIPESGYDCENFYEEDIAEELKGEQRMKLIIDIPEEVKQKIDENLNSCDLDIYDCVMLATKNGISLTKGHGDLIDSNVLCEKYDMCLDLYQALDLTPVIIKGE